MGIMSRHFSQLLLFISHFEICLTRIPVPRVLQWLAMPSPIPIVTGGMAHMKISRNGQSSNLVWRIWILMIMLRFLSTCRKRRILLSRRTRMEYTSCQKWLILKQFDRNRGLSEATLGLFIVCFFNSYSFPFSESDDRRLHWEFKISIPLQSVIKGWPNHLLTWLCPRIFYTEWSRSPQWLQGHSSVQALVGKTTRRKPTIHYS